MESINKPYLLKVSLLSGLSILISLALSFVVYQSTVKVKDNAIDLVEHRIPILTSINELIADLSEQERIIYEYYRSQEGQDFLASSQAIRQTFDMHLTAILSQARFANEADIIVNGQQRIIALFDVFYEKMQLEADNWDELRDILTQVSALRIELLPTLKLIEQQTKQTVDEGHKTTLTQMSISHWLVISYGLAIVLLGGIIAWYLRQYILTQAKNTRLALFSHRNPNPILSVDNSGELAFANPSSYALLDDVGLSGGHVKDLLPENFPALQQQLRTQNNSNMVFESVINDHVLQTSIYWHDAIAAFDIHIKDITEGKLAEQQLNQLAFYHQDTQLPNQYQFTRDIDDLIEEVDDFSLGILAIRAFEDQLSTFGAETTKAIVQVLTNNIDKVLPENVGFYQTSDSHFGVLCRNSNNSLALQKLTKVINSVTEQALITKFGEFFIDLDFGYACFPNHGKNSNVLIKSAHSALAVASDNEHDNFCLYQATFSEIRQKNIMLLSQLRHAVERKELFLVFQPQLDITQNKITGIETLVRWQQGGDIISPVDFIPLAEQSGLIIPIGQWILEQACLFAKTLINLGYDDIVVAVNVSPRQFTHPQFCHMVHEVLTSAQLPPKYLELEITEGVFMHNEENTLAVLQQLKSSGLQLSIDDFGTGYSSLSYLKRFPIDKLKIDQSFIRGCHHNDEDKALIATIVSLGKSLNLSLIAEGVEEQSHVDYLASIGCDEIQGYWFSRPILGDDLITLLAERSIPEKIKTLDAVTASS
jgi:EAL domain-containing protein (putative c-di-GMP-specific phosphodiesterase class I)/GGDEF domain-containing protein